jgi:hypothetical protein
MNGDDLIPITNKDGMIVWVTCHPNTAATATPGRHPAAATPRVGMHVGATTRNAATADTATSDTGANL